MQSCSQSYFPRANIKIKLPAIIPDIFIAHYASQSVLLICNISHNRNSSWCSFKWQQDYRRKSQRFQTPPWIVSKNTKLSQKLISNSSKYLCSDEYYYTKEGLFYILSLRNKERIRGKNTLKY